MTKNFKIEDFVSKGFPENPNKIESFLLNNMVVNILQPIRDELNSPMLISDCRRSVVKYKNMIDRGLFPSETSDHFWNQEIPLVSEKKINLYGPIYKTSVGAIDFVVRNMNNIIVFNAIRKMVIDGKIKVGQLIAERSKTSEWIHISNPTSILYSDEFISSLPAREKFLVSRDGGQSYERVS